MVEAVQRLSLIHILSTITVESAYAQLVAEGFLYTCLLYTSSGCPIIPLKKSMTESG